MELGVIDEERTNILDDIRYLESRIAVQRELIRKLSRMRSKGAAAAARDLLQMLLISLARIERRRVASAGA